MQKQSQVKAKKPRDSKPRCHWVTADQIYIDYHDHEWGVKVTDDKLLFEMLVLESFQAGLNWLTILKRRKGFRKAFANFKVNQVVAFKPADIKRLLNDEGIIRHRGKIEATINNAARFIEVQKEFGSFAKFLKPYTNAKILSKELKRRGFKFLGETTVYAYMQAIGLVKDHDENCFLF